MTITPAMIPFTVIPDNSFAITPARWNDNIVLAANVAATYTFPTGAAIVIMSATADFYAAWRYTGDGTPPTASVPAANTSTGVGFDLNPKNRYVGGMAAVSLVSAVSCIISLASYEM